MINLSDLRGEFFEYSVEGFVSGFMLDLEDVAKIARDKGHTYLVTPCALANSEGVPFKMPLNAQGLIEFELVESGYLEYFYFDGLDLYLEWGNKPSPIWKKKYRILRWRLSNALISAVAKFFEAI